MTISAQMGEGEVLSAELCCFFFAYVLADSLAMYRVSSTFGADATSYASGDRLVG